jgi:hypothetical protein
MLGVTFGSPSKPPGDQWHYRTSFLGRRSATNEALQSGGQRNFDVLCGLVHRGYLVLDLEGCCYTYQRHGFTQLSLAFAVSLAVFPKVRRFTDRASLVTRWSFHSKWLDAAMFPQSQEPALYPFGYQAFPSVDLPRNDGHSSDPEAGSVYPISDFVWQIFPSAACQFGRAISPQPNRTPFKHLFPV